MENKRLSKVIVFFTVVGTICALLAVPEARRLIGLDTRSATPGNASGQRPLANDRPADQSPPQHSRTTPKDRYTVRVFNCDDGGRILLNGKVVGKAGFGEDTGAIDITDQLKQGDNTINFQVLNSEGAITYGFQVGKNGTIIFDQQCGEHHRYGCEDNRKDFPVGVGREFNFTITVP